VSPLQRFSIRVGREASLAPSLRQRPHASATSALTCISRPSLEPPRWPLADIDSRACRLGRRIHPLSVVTAASSRVRLRPDVVCPRPPVPHRSNRPTRALRTDPCHDRPDRPFLIDRTPLLRFRTSPSALVGRVARSLRRRPASRRVPLRRLCQPSARAAPWDLGRRAFALAVFRFFSARSARRRSSRRTFGVGRSIVANVSRCHSTRVCVQLSAGHAFVDREDAIPVVFRSVARVGSV